MKKFDLKKLLYLMSIMLLAGMVMVSCKKDDDDDDPNGDDPVLVEDGMYLKGDGTALTDFDLKGMLKATRNEVNQEDRASLLEIYVAVQGGDAGFNIVEVAGENRITYGPGPDFALVPVEDRIIEEPQEAGLWRGSVVETDAKFTVPNDGLYHVVFDTELGVGAIVHVASWGLIGAATPGGWGGDTEMASTGFDLNEITFEATDVTMTQADFKFRYSGAWKVIIDDEVVIGDGVEGVRVNANFGGAVDNLVPGGANIANTEGGIYTAKMVWSLSDGYAAELTKTGDLDAFDYSDTELGLIGGGIIVDGESWGWDDGYELHLPVVEGETNYTWTWNNVEVDTEGGGFKIREGDNWEGISFGYPQVTMDGLAADNFETNDDGNFVPVEAGVFNIVFHIDAVTDVRTFTVNPADAAAMLWVPGEYQGWNPAEAPTLEDASGDGVFTGTVEFPESANYDFKFTNQPNWDGTNYGDGGAEGTLSDDGGAGNLSVPGPGTYNFTVDLENMTWAYELE